MPRTVKRLAMLAAALLPLLAIGCSKSGSAGTSAGTSGSAPTDMTQGPRKQGGGGAAPDTSTTPAPAGVKTGNYEGGRK